MSKIVKPLHESTTIGIDGVERPNFMPGYAKRMITYKSTVQQSIETGIDKIDDIHFEDDENHERVHNIGSNHFETIRRDDDEIIIDHGKITHIIKSKFGDFNGVCTNEYTIDDAYKIAYLKAKISEMNFELEELLKRKDIKNNLEIII